MIALFVLPALAQGTPWDADLGGAPATEIVQLDASGDAFAVSGFAVGGVGGGSGVALSQASVVGGDGGTTVWSSEARLRWESWVVAARLPFATFRTSAGRETGLGNLQLDLLGLNDPVDPTAHVGVEVHLPVGQAYTWANEAEEVWPGAGFNLVYGRQVQSAGTTGVVRVAGGLHFTGGYAPYPQTLIKIEVAGLVDQVLAPGVGVVAETSVAYWDPTPWDVAGLVRVDPVSGLRLRGGIILPLLSWAGAQPSSVPAGVREATLRVDLGMAL